MRHPLAALVGVDSSLGVVAEFNPNSTTDAATKQDTDVTYATLAKRWEELLAWLGKSKSVPEIHSQIESWKAFQTDWVNASFDPRINPGIFNIVAAGKAAFTPKPVDRLGTQSSDLASAESNAHAHGYVVPMLKIADSGSVERADVGQLTGKDSPSPASPADAGRRLDATVVPAMQTPGIELRHPIAASAPGADPNSPPELVPMPVKIAALFTIAATSVAATSAMKSDGHRAVAAGGGLLVTAAAAWAMFWPARKEEKKS